MSRIDYITIALVAICLFVLAYIFIRIGNLNDNTNQHNPTATLTDTIEASPISKQDTLLTDSDDTLSPQVTDTISTEEKVPTENTPINIAPSNTSLSYMVVAASFNTTELAEQERQRLSKLGYQQSEIGYFNKGAYAAVIVQRFASYSQAQALAAQLKQKHKIDAYVHQKRTTPK